MAVVRWRIFAQQGGAHVPQHAAPDFALPMHLIARTGNDRIARNTGVRRRRIDVDVSEGQWIDVQVGRVRIAPYAVIIILRQAAELIAGVSSHRVIAPEVVTELA